MLHPAALLTLIHSHTHCTCDGRHPPFRSTSRGQLPARFKGAMPPPCRPRLPVGRNPFPYPSSPPSSVLELNLSLLLISHVYPKKHGSSSGLKSKPAVYVHFAPLPPVSTRTHPKPYSLFSPPLLTADGDVECSVLSSAHKHVMRALQAPARVNISVAVN